MTGSGACGPPGAVRRRGPRPRSRDGTEGPSHRSPRGGSLIAFLVLASAWPTAAAAQVGPVLEGRALLGDGPLGAGTVVLHEITDSTQGPIDSVAVASDGTFRLTLPARPDAAADRFYFGSLRHAGITYFGPALERPAQLDSIYEIQAWDTLVAPPDGAEITIQARNLFFEPAGEEWRITDIFQLRNDTGRTVVAAEEGATVWRYPLPAGARDFTSGQGPFSFDATVLEEGAAVVRTAIAPGERIFVFRYMVDSPFGRIPTAGLTEAFDLLVREPAPRVGVEGLEIVGPIEIEEGSTYRRYTGAEVGPATEIRVVEVRPPGELPYEWITALVGLALAAAAVLVIVRRPAPASTAGASSPPRSQAKGRSPRSGAGRSGRSREDPAPAGSNRKGGGKREGGTNRAGGGAAAVPEARREALLLEIARLDEDFGARAAPSEEEGLAYRTRRQELLERLKGRAQD